jgi:hypothetical protein
LPRAGSRGHFRPPPKNHPIQAAKQGSKIAETLIQSGIDRVNERISL